MQEDQGLLQKLWKQTIRVAVSGAGGNISHHLLFMVQSSHHLHRHKAKWVCANVC